MSDQEDNRDSDTPAPAIQPTVRVKRSSGPSKLLLLLFGLVVVLALYVLTASFNRPANGRRSVAVGKSLSALELAPLTGNGEAINLDQLEGRVTMINYWGTWCPPCVREFPHMVQIREELESHEDFQFFSVSCLSSPTGNEAVLREQTLNFMEYIKARTPTHSDLGVKSRLALASTFNSENMPFPATVLLDRRGVIRGLWLGYLPGDEQDMKEAAMEVLMSKE